jgi:hypothetical protein
MVGGDPGLTRPAKAEAMAVALVAAHSLGIGLVLLFATDWGVRLGGFGAVTPLFFARQAGAFHLVVAAGYTLEYLDHRGVSFLLATKAIAVAFLCVVTVASDVPWPVPLSAAGDATMGVGVALLHRAARRAQAT